MSGILARDQSHSGRASQTPSRKGSHCTDRMRRKHGRAGADASAHAQNPVTDGAFQKIIPRISANVRKEAQPVGTFAVALTLTRHDPNAGGERVTKSLSSTVLLGDPFPP